MHVTFVMPCVGKKQFRSAYPKSWIMEPLPISTLSALTPRSINRQFFDDRTDTISYDIPTDLVAITVETYTARRAYQIASVYRKRGVPVVMGGFHPTLMPDEAAAHADALVLGQAEAVWADVLEDAAKGSLKPRYEGKPGTPFCNIIADRSIYNHKRYSLVTLIETGRGCPYSCEFCSISSFYHRTYTPRSIESIVEEIKLTRPGYIFFTDDNIVVNRERSIALFEALIPLKVKWVSQMSIQAANDKELLSLMRRSGCAGVLIGFESLNSDTLSVMGKNVNMISDYDQPLKNLRDLKLVVYATFVFGYDGDSIDTFEKTYRFARKNKFFFCAFNHLVPFPGTSVYERFEYEGRLLYDKWWLSDKYSFGDVAFRPSDMTPQQLADTCHHYRKRFYSLSSVLSRGLDFRANAQNPLTAAIFFTQNLQSLREINLRRGLPLGVNG